MAKGFKTQHFEDYSIVKGLISSKNISLVRKSFWNSTKTTMKRVEKEAARLLKFTL